MSRYDGYPYEMYPDNCERCAGLWGGVRGNENVIDGRVLCDYCSCAVDGGPEKKELVCFDCDLPISTHVLMKVEQIEAIWEQGISLEICGESSCNYPNPSKQTLVSLGEQGPDNPCDVDYMKEISS